MQGERTCQGLSPDQCLPSSCLGLLFSGPQLPPNQDGPRCGSVGNCVACSLAPRLATYVPGELGSCGHFSGPLFLWRGAEGALASGPCPAVDLP